MTSPTFPISERLFGGLGDDFKSDNLRRQAAGRMAKADRSAGARRLGGGDDGAWGRLGQQL
jgi:hypothetical protein